MAIIRAVRLGSLGFMSASSFPELLQSKEINPGQTDQNVRSRGGNGEIAGRNSWIDPATLTTTFCVAYYGRVQRGTFRSAQIPNLQSPVEGKSYEEDSTLVGGDRRASSRCLGPQGRLRTR